MAAKSIGENKANENGVASTDAKIAWRGWLWQLAGVASW